MELRLLRFAISFLSGVLWTLFLLSLFYTFTHFMRYSLGEAIVYSFILSIFWLFLILLVELAHLQVEKLKELRRQSHLLERIARKLDGNR
ncbi:MAG: hypothetical protein C6I00_02030 [Nitratiruptor sp.]|jgi:membrane protein DedA with SNARE-associated domain|nr:hypothetical protein [Nitratiruptor sp.]NPA84068.1 hypothetical protein [Campylobacterota bacterium]